MITEIATRIDKYLNYVNDSPEVLLAQAREEIARLNTEVKELNQQRLYQPGSETNDLIRIARLNGFRLVYHADTDEKKEMSRRLAEKLLSRYQKRPDFKKVDSLARQLSEHTVNCDHPVVKN